MSINSKYPIISIIIPVYNAGEYLSQCIESVLNQTFTNWELILVNDGSVDNSLQICNFFKERDDRIIIIDKKNEGVGKARNDGILKARGIYLCFIDADDWINSKTLDQVFAKSNNGFFDLIQFGCVRFTGKDKILSYRRPPEVEITINEDNSSLILMFESGNAFAVWGKLIRKSIIFENKLWFDTKKRGEDIDFISRLLLHVNHIRCISDIFYNYRVLYNVTNKYDKSIIENHINNYVLFNNLFINCNDNKLVQNYLAKLYLLWFIIVIPINISGNSKISFTDKIEEFKKIFQNHNAKEIYLQKSKKNLEIKYKFLSFLYFFNSPLILLFFSSMLQKVRSKLNLTN
jgi:glycosyltransferase involved in cell wall biosynthesis